MKKIIAICLVVLIMMRFCGCKNSNKPEENGDPQASVQAAYPLDKYDLDAYTTPYWSGNVVYQESVMVLENEDGTVDDIQLLYSADAIISVRSSDLQTAYKEGTDYTLVDGKLHIPEGSSVTKVTHDTYYPKWETETSMPLNEKYGPGYIFFSEGALMHTMQIAVTYTHADAFDGAVPAYKGDRLPKTKAKLENNEPLRMVVFGDSISTGVCSTGKVTALPMAKPWFEMFADKLKQTYGLTNLSLYNPSVGGKRSDWGVEEAQNAVGHGPDLCIIGFGMNDGTKRCEPKTYQQNIRTIMNTALAANPDCEFVLIATILPNPEVNNFLGNQKDFLPMLLELEKEGVVVADMTTFHEGLLQRKRYCDMSGNNVNHPNDFLARAYTQVLWQTVVGEKESTKAP